LVGQDDDDIESSDFRTRHGRHRDGRRLVMPRVWQRLALGVTLALPATVLSSGLRSGDALWRLVGTADAHSPHPIRGVLRATET